MTITTEHMDRLTATQSAPVPLAYGRHVVAGNLILRDDQAGQSVLFVALGEGEWDAAETVYLNGVALAASKFHFHPGKDGEVGTGGVDGDQKIDLWFPGGLQGTTFSRTAYIAILADDVIFAPTDDFDIRGIYRTRKVKTFDSIGTELSFAYSANPVWCALDLLLLREPQSRIDFASFAAEATYADATLTINTINYPRFECHVAFPRQVDLGRALEAVLATCRGYLVDDGGKISIGIDKARSGVHTLDMSNTRRGAFRHWNRDTRSQANRLRVKFRDLENDFAPTSLLVEREWHQELIGKVTEFELDIGNSYQQQARRLGEYFITRAVDDQMMVAATAAQDALHLQPGDVVNVENDLAPWDGQKAFEVIEATDGVGDERELLLQEYDGAAFPDTGEPKQDNDGGVITGPGTIPAGHVTNVSASENKFVTPQDGTLWSRVTVSWDLPSPLGTWGAVEIWARRLDGASMPIEPWHFFEKFEESPGYFLTEPTGDELEIVFRSVNVVGRVNAIAGSPTTTVVLDAAPSAPAAIADLWCQQLTEGLRLSWSEGAETNLSHYEVANAGSVTPAVDADLTDAHVIATVQANPTSGTKAFFDFKEKEHTGNSDTTTVTLSTDTTALFFPSGALVVGGVGRMVTFLNADGTVESHQVVSNTQRTITFAATTIPTGEVRFLLRDADGVHKLYVRPVNRSGQKGTWKPPPTVLSCFPFARDGTKDVLNPNTPVEFGSVGGGLNSSWFALHPRATIVGHPIQPGHFIVHLAVRANDETEIDFDLALNQNNNGLVEVEVKVKHSDDGETGLVESIFPFDLPNAREDYLWQDQGVGGSRWVYNYTLPPTLLPNQGIDSVFLRVKNSFGWSAFGTLGIQAFAAPGSKPYWTGNGNLKASATQAADASNNIYPNLAETQEFLISGVAADATIKKPEYRSKNETPGAGLAPIGDEHFSMVIEQGATPRRFVWDPEYKGVSDTVNNVSMEPNTYTAYVFRNESPTFLRCISRLQGVVA